MDLGSLTAYTKPGFEYKIELEPYNSSQDQWIRINYTPDSPITAFQLLEYFRDRLNEISELSFKDDFNDSNTQVQSFTPIIKGTRLVLKLDRNDRKFWIRQAISTLADNGELFHFPRDNQHFYKIGELLRARNQDCADCNETKQNYSFGSFSQLATNTSLTRGSGCVSTRP